MTQKRTLKEIALELLDKYRVSEAIAIDEYSGDIVGEHKQLDAEIASYKAEIDAANHPSD